MGFNSGFKGLSIDQNKTSSNNL